MGKHGSLPGAFFYIHIVNMSARPVSPQDYMIVFSTTNTQLTLYMHAGTSLTQWPGHNALIKHMRTGNKEGQVTWTSHGSRKVLALLKKNWLRCRLHGPLQSPRNQVGPNQETYTACRITRDKRKRLEQEDTNIPRFTLHIQPRFSIGGKKLLHMWDKHLVKAGQLRLVSDRFFRTIDWFFQRRTELTLKSDNYKSMVAIKRWWWTFLKRLKHNALCQSYFPPTKKTIPSCVNDIRLHALSIPDSNPTQHTNECMSVWIL